MHGFTPEHALLDAKAFTIYYGLPMVAKYDKHMKEHVKASPAYIRRRFVEVVLSYMTTGAVYSVYLMLPDYFPTPGKVYTNHYWSLSYLLSPLCIRNAKWYGGKAFTINCKLTPCQTSTDVVPWPFQLFFRLLWQPVATVEILCLRC